MRDEGDKVCPLCAEEMDLTDQHLKPCRCGYEICVWCWHQIISLAEKDDREGRCPACRTPYNKEKIVATSENCKRLVEEVNMERKLKSHKTKSKTSDGRKQLSSARVIQRNLVYVMCIPLNVADEDLLRQKEYFGQYGKVLKVSISRTAGGSIQQFPNSTCSVYVTYSKEEEAVRCIQSIHGFFLDGRSLRACFGTTKYCHAWLRNMPCSNPECLYLHEYGSEEDSVTKDDIISTYTRNRVQQITVAATNMQRRSGSVLPPPPPDDHCINDCAAVGKTIRTSASNNSASTGKSSPLNSISCQSVSIPVAVSWATRTSMIQASSSSLTCPSESHKQNSDTSAGSLGFSVSVAGSTQVSMLQDDVETKVLEPNIEMKLNDNDDGQTTKSSEMGAHKSEKKYVMDSQKMISAAKVLGHSVSTRTSTQLCRLPACKDKDGSVVVPPSVANPGDIAQEKDILVSTDDSMWNLCSSMSSVSIGRHKGLQLMDSERPRNLLTSLPADVARTLPEGDSCVRGKQLDWRSDSQTQKAQFVNSELEDNLQSFNIQRLKDPQVYTTGLPNMSHSFDIINNSRAYSGQNCQPNCSLDIVGGLQTVDRRNSEVLRHKKFDIPEASDVNCSATITKSACSDDFVDCFSTHPDEGRRKQVGRLEGAVESADHNVSVNKGEHNIISNILSMDFDLWDEPFTSSQNLAKMLGEPDKQENSVRSSDSWKTLNSKQSRFSFARELELVNEVNGFEQTLYRERQAPSEGSLSLNFAENRNSLLNQLSNCDGLLPVSVEFDSFSSSTSHSSTSKFSASRNQLSAPPGFSPARRTPPGFTSHEKMEQPYGTHFGNYIYDTSSSSRDQYQSPSAISINNPRDIEIVDPAILAVGSWKLPGGLDSQGLDMRSISPMFRALEDEAKLQNFMQSPNSQFLTQRLGHMEGFFPHHEGIHTSVVERTLGNNLSTLIPTSFPQSRSSLVSSGPLNGWNEVPSAHNLGIMEQPRTDRLGINKFYAGYEDPVMRIPDSRGLYNRTFGV